MPTRSGHTTAIRASRVLGAGVQTPAGDVIGAIADVILDKTTNRIMFAVVRRAGQLTAVDNFYPVAWSDLDYDEERQAYLLPFGASELDRLPAVSAIQDLTADDGAAWKGRGGEAR